jgi:16S rRNA A1518/A1519 N6-dimethyltransferase RsmA/KsgA/DIM1 with predicted DNA glycosylase/AP lyase activity
MKLSEMREMLERRGIQLTKSLGQNFLHDGNQLRRIVGAAQLTKQDQVLEIGPGLGPLTELLVGQAGEVLAIEKDARLLEVLAGRFGLEFRLQPEERSRAQSPEAAPTRPETTTSLTPTLSPGRGRTFSGAGRDPRCSDGFQRGNKQAPLPGERAGVRASVTSNRISGAERQNSNLRLLHADALEYLKHEPRDWSGWKLVANLPYSVASPILVELAQGERSPQRMVATLQLEVARKLMAKAGDDDYGLLTLLVQIDFEPRDWFKVPAGCFHPKPDVDSACVCLVRREQSLLAPAQREMYKIIVKRAFSQRRKMMLKLLKQDWPAETLERAFETLKLPAQIRAEAVSLGQFTKLTGLLI